MRVGEDIMFETPGFMVIHQNMPGRKVEFHSHEEHHLFIPLEANVSVEVANQKIDFDHKHMFYMPGAVEHAFYSKQQRSGELLICMISDKLWNQFSDGENSPHLLPVSHFLKESLFYLLLSKSKKIASPLVEIIITALKEQLEFAGKESSLSFEHLTGTTNDARLKKALRYLETNYKEELSLPEVAENSGLSVRTMNRVFMGELHMTPKQFLTRVRIEHASRLLKKRGSNVTQVAFESGFGSLTQFISAFRTITGMLPSVYKNQ